MNPVIKYTLIITWLSVLILPQLMLADLSPQHAEFLKLFFWEFPKALVKMWVPGL